MKIPGAVAKVPSGKYEPGMMSAEWLVKQIWAKRIVHYNVCSISTSTSSDGEVASEVWLTGVFLGSRSERDRRGTRDAVLLISSYV